VALAAIFFVAAMPVNATNDEQGIPTSPGPGPLTFTTEDTGSLTTIFAGGNGFAGNTFDIENITTVDVTLNGWEVHLDDPPNVTNTIDIYWRVGTALGFEENPSGWTLLGSDPSVVSNGAGVPTPVSMPDFTIQPGEVFGFYLVNSTYGTTGMTINYTDGGPNTYQNTEIALTTYHGVGDVLFGSPTFFPRIWNGTVYYDFIPVELQSFTIE
jgi:hypothetical protein